MKSMFEATEPGLAKAWSLWRYPFAALWLLASSTVPAFALPWDQPLNTIAQSLDGTVARTAAMIIVGFTGLMIAFGEHKGLFATVMRILFGLSLALAASQWVGLV